MLIDLLLCFIDSHRKLFTRMILYNQFIVKFPKTFYSVYLFNVDKQFEQTHHRKQDTLRIFNIL